MANRILENLVMEETKIKKKKFFQGIGQNVILLGFVSFINDISSDMMMAVLPMFITSIGGAGIAIGLIGGLGDSIASILKVFSGYWSDKFKRRKPFAFYGYLVSSMAKLLFPLSQNWLHLLVFRPIERIGKGLRTAPRDAIIAGSTSPETKGKAFGIHRAADTSGAFIGALLAFIFYWVLKLDFKPILLISAILSFFALIPFFWIKEKVQSKQSLLQKKISLRINLKNLPDNFKNYLIVSIIFGLANFTYMFFILRARNIFSGFLPHRLATAIPILLYIWFNIFQALFSIPCGILSDKIGRKRVLFLGYLSYALTCLGFALFSSLVSFIGLFAIYGISFALIEGNQRAFASDFVKEDLRGTALGTFHTAISLSVLPAGLIAGLLWNYNPQFTFYYGAILSFLAVIGISHLKKEDLS